MRFAAGSRLFFFSGFFLCKPHKKKTGFSPASERVDLENHLVLLAVLCYNRNY
jgi:hypothetical protein